MDNHQLNQQAFVQEKMKILSEEELDRLCPACRARAEEARCPGCGAPVGTPVKESNPNFDWARFERLKQEGGAI